MSLFRGIFGIKESARRLAADLSDPRRYLEQIDRLHLKYSQGRRLFDLEQDGVALASFCLSRKRVARILAESVGAGRYALQPARARWVTIHGKPRLLYQLRLTDRIVHGVVSTLVNERVQPQLSDRLYSYRRGQHWWKAVADFARYVRAHRRIRPDPRARGLYVMRRDVQKYTDSIPVGDRSPLWQQLKDLLGLEPQRDKRSANCWNLVRNVVRPETYSEGGFLYQNVYGLPTGSPISTTLFNLYLMPLDNALGSIPGAFYARYSDDILFAHPDASVVRHAIDQLESILKERRLSTNRNKDEDFYFTGAGRASSVWVSATGTTGIAFLGCHVTFEGTVSLKSSKVHQLLSDLRTRVERTLKALPVEDAAMAGPTVCAMINAVLDPETVCRQKSALLLRSVVTHRPQLKDIDYHVARIIAETLTGESSVRAFRQVPYRKLRDDWKLISLCHQRNRMYRASRKPGDPAARSRGTRDNAQVRSLA
jgi:hypothetical protein